MSTVTIDAFDDQGQPISLTGVDLAQGTVTISTIDKEQEWTLKTIDDTPDTVSTDHLGATPGDRS